MKRLIFVELSPIFVLMGVFALWEVAFIIFFGERMVDGLMPFLASSSVTEFFVALSLRFLGVSVFSWLFFFALVSLLEKRHKLEAESWTKFGMTFLIFLKPVFWIFSPKFVDSTQELRLAFVFLNLVLVGLFFYLMFRFPKRPKQRITEGVLDQPFES